MTQRFILDENVVILAQKLENDKGERDSTCRQLFDDIIKICHTLVFDPLLWRKYHQQMRLLRHHDPHGPRSILRLLYLATQMQGKLHILHAAAPEFPEEGAIPQGSQDDVPIVRLAVETVAILVTTDGDLPRDLIACGVQEKYHLRVLTPGQALASL